MYDDYPVGNSMYGDPDAPLKLRLDIKKASMVTDVSLDDIVTIVVTGKVKRLDGADEYKSEEYNGKDKPYKEVKRVSPGCLEVEVSKVKISSNGAFDVEDSD